MHNPNIISTTANTDQCHHVYERFDRQLLEGPDILSSLEYRAFLFVPYTYDDA